MTIQKNNVTLLEVLNEFEKQTGYSFVYTKQDIPERKTVSLNVKNESAESALKKLLSPLDVVSEFSDNYVTLRADKAGVKDQGSKAQGNIVVAGTIIDKNGEPLIGASIRVKGNPILGGVADVDGKFTISNVPSNSTLIFSYLAYANVDYDISKLSVNEAKNMRIVMEEESGLLEEVVVTATGVQKKVSVVAAITPIDPSELKAPTRSLSSQLAGRVAGMTFVQSTGQPGKDGASFIIRGINSVIGSSEPLILIDGLKRTLDDVDPNDIESFAVLKDASATAVYGLEGANGIVVIKTRGGIAASKPVVNASYSTSITNTTAKPDWVDSYNYAKMRNEAAIVRDQRPIYSASELEMFLDDDPDTYPNTDWYDTMFKGNNFAQKGNFNISGGGNVVTYFASGGFYSEEGMFNSKITEYDSNANYSQFNFRANLNADVTSSTKLGVSLDGRYNTTTEPGQTSLSDLFRTTYYINPTLFPAAYSDGSAPVEPNGVRNPYSLMTRTGFSRYYSNTMSANVNLTQQLDMITPGLFVTAVASFTKLNNYAHRYVKKYNQHEIDYANSYMGTGRDENGNLLTKAIEPIVDEKMTFVNNVGDMTGNRMVEVQGTANYKRMFVNDKLDLSALILYKQREVLQDNPANNLIAALPSREQSLAGRVTLGWVSRYFSDINFGGSGSQMFTPDKRWSYFPSIGLGWLASEENFWKPIVDKVNYLKLRSSFGIVGSTGSASRFGYLAQTGAYTGYTFGFGVSSNSGQSISGLGETRLEQLGLTWEKNKKIDLGLEFELFHQLRFVIDAYRNDRSDQLIDLNSLPSTLGLPATPKANLGEMTSKGFEVDVTWTKNWNKFHVGVKGLLAYNTDKIIENGQLDPRMPYQSGIGLNWGRSLNYIALGLFEDQDDIDSSPVQKLGSTVRPGDIKYKDINGDGIINSEDRIWLGYTTPKWTYSMNFDFGYDAWDFSFRFIGKSDMFRSIQSRVPFASATISENANYVSAIYWASVNDHWTPESYSGTKATENPNATYPRLGYGAENSNNVVQSSFWLRDASYLRLADVQIGYTWTPKASNLPFKGFYFYGRGENLHTFSKFKDWNPEQTNPAAYPLKMTLSLGMEIKFKL